MNHHLRFFRALSCPNQALIACACALLVLPSCQSDRLLAVSESVPPSLARDKPYLQFQCYFLSVPGDFDLLKKTEGVHVAGIYSPTDGEKLLDSLQRRRNVDLVSSPSMTSRDGQSGRIEMIREFIYPTEYEPAKLDSRLPGSVAGAFPVSPATPTAFEKVNTGVSAEFEGKRNKAGEIAFTFTIERRVFLGFVNYGSPITAPATNALGKPVDVILTENRIEMPVFDTRRIASTVTLKDGHFLALGGLSPDSYRNLQKELVREGGASGFTPAEEEDNLFVLIRVTSVAGSE